MTEGAILALDPGTKRIGIAVTDPDRRIALPLTVLERKPGWLDEIRSMVQERGVVTIVVGLPKSLDGSEGKAAAGARELASEVGERLGLPVELVDERLSTVSAGNSLGRLSSKGQRGVIDAVAASIILQSYLDSGASK